MVVFTHDKKNKIWYSMLMTEGQRDYLADLAARKGVQLANTENVSAAWASAKIDELKALPDATFKPLDDMSQRKVTHLIENIQKELGLWTFQA